ncbi:amidohydrolase family protein [Permianibacter sp. IMCC34836]|nr:amidohydrolase family protein [Permianibacter fluminis]
MRYGRQLGVAAALLLALAGCGDSSDGPDQQGAIYVNAKVYTQNDQRQVAEAFVVADGKFLQVGSRADAESYNSRGFQIVDLGGKMVLPGLHDNHVHGLGTVALDMCDLDGEPVTLDELAAKVTVCLAHYAIPDGQWLVINQWVPYEGNDPTVNYSTVLQALDAAAPNHPVMLSGVDGHASAYNTVALAMALDADGNTVGYSSESLAPGGVFEVYAPYVNLESGVIREDARYAIPSPDTNLLSASGPEADALYGAILPGVAEMFASRGITSIQDACVNDFVRSQYSKMEAQSLLHMRVTAATCFVADDYGGVVDIDGHLAKANEVRSAFAADPLIKADAVKIFIDGVLEGDPFSNPPFAPNAGMLHNFQTPHLHYDADSGAVTVEADSEDSGNNGIVNYETDVLKDYVSALDAAGFSVHMHSIGDRSTRAAIDALQAARDRNGASGIPHTIAHLQMVHPDDQQRLGALGVYLTFTYAWIGTLPEYDVLVTPFIEPSVAGQDILSVLYNASSYSWSAVYPVESSRQAGATLVAGSDAPVDKRDPRPFVNIAAGVTRASAGGLPYNAAQRTSLTEMIAAYTINGARAVRQQAISGSIETGKSADFVVLDRNLFDLVASGHPEQIADTEVELTVFRGEPVYRKP